MINFCKTSLPNDRAHAIAAITGKILPVIDIVIEFDVAPIIIIVSTDSNVVYRVL